MVSECKCLAIVAAMLAEVEVEKGVYEKVIKLEVHESLIIRLTRPETNVFVCSQHARLRISYQLAGLLS